VLGAEFIHGDFSDIQLPEGSFDGVVALHAVSHVPRQQHGKLFADVYRWLTPGGLFLAVLGATDRPDWIGEWLGEQMFFSSHDANTNRRMMRAAGFRLQVDEVAVTHEPEGDVSFLWVIGAKDFMEATNV
jgi:cyclopropane fatty-acyl-phospholipid synthase-like methyltransferase